MSSPKPELPNIKEEDRTPLVDVLLELLAWQSQQIDELEQEILKLKGETTKPEVKPSAMDKSTGNDSDEDKENDETSTSMKGPKRSKKGQIPIDDTKIVQPDNIPEGSRFKGYRRATSRLMIDFGTPCHKNRFATRRIIRLQTPCVRLDHAQNPHS
jgi:hypothetical protein